MERYQEYINLALELGAIECIAILAESIVTAPWVTYKCQFGCEFYGRRHTCPPATPDYRRTGEIIKCFTYGLLLHTNDASLTRIIIPQLDRRLFLDGYYRVISMVGGPCRRCAVCNPDCCNFPKDNYPSMEACGIDVFQSVRNNGLHIEPLRCKDEPHHSYSLILIE